MRLIPYRLYGYGISFLFANQSNRHASTSDTTCQKLTRVILSWNPPCVTYKRNCRVFPDRQARSTAKINLPRIAVGKCTRCSGYPLPCAIIEYDAEIPLRKFLAGFFKITELNFIWTRDRHYCRNYRTIGQHKVLRLDCSEWRDCIVVIAGKIRYALPVYGGGTVIAPCAAVIP